MLNRFLLLGSPDKAGKADALKRTLQISNLTPLLTADHLKQLFAFCGTVVDCTITDSKHFAYIEYSKPEEATAALALNNMDVGGRPLNVEMAKSLPPKNVNNTSLMMQQAVALQQMQFQQALLMQQTLASQQAASRAATMKSATEMASARAAEISKKLKADGFGGDEKEAQETSRKSRSPSPQRHKSKSRSRSPIKYRRNRRSRSISPSIRFQRDRRSRSPMRSYYLSRGNERRTYRDDRDSYSRGGRREWERSGDRYSSTSRRNQSRSASPRSRRSARAGSVSPKHRRESLSPRTRRSSQASSRSPRHHRGSRSSPTRDDRTADFHRSRDSRSRSAERRHHSDSKEDTKNSEKLKKDSQKSDKSSADKSTKDLRELKGDRKGGDASAGSHKRSSLEGERSLKNERGSNHDKKSNLDDRNGEKTDSVTKDHDTMGEYLDSNEDKRSHSPISKEQKRGSARDTDDIHAEHRESSRHEISRTTYKKHDKIDSPSKEREDLGSNEDKRPLHSPVSKEHKRASSRNKDDIHAERKESSRHERSSSGYKKHERTDYPSKEGEDLGSNENKRSIRSPVSKEHKRGSARNKGDIHAEHRESSRHERSSSYYKKHERNDSPTKESESRGRKRSSHHSGSRSHRSSRHFEERSPDKDHYKQEKSRDDLKKPETVETIFKEPRSSSRRQEKTLDSSNMTYRSSYHPTEDKVATYSKDSEYVLVNKEKRQSVNFDYMTDNVDSGHGNLTGKKEFDHDSETDKSSMVEDTDKRSSMAEDNGTYSLGQHDHGKDEESKLESEYPTVFDNDTYNSGENLSRLPSTIENPNCVEDAAATYTGLSNQILKVESYHFNMEDENMPDASKSEAVLNDPISRDFVDDVPT
ncbi:uncharacterized protein M6B38_182395 [Iris pallida]|uniref:RRM domain-containing protein n=1 Tax=Iris pallida TaxID=29817 RepID=A0AAX6ELL2_IRIPA|nr:uncharacterized protein M6B38_182395 [Iris pallida]